MAFISGQLLHPRYEDIFKMLQELADAEIQWYRHTRTQTDYYNPPTTLGLIIVFIVIYSMCR